METFNMTTDKKEFFVELADKINKENFIGLNGKKVVATVKENNDKGLRYNKGKIRFDLFEPFAMKQLAMVFTKGAEKYADRNWESGMKWSKMRASLERHLRAYDAGEDFDYDPNCEDCKNGTCVNHTGLYHMSQVAWNALGILSYYKLYPQGDDRSHHYLNVPKIGLDIDDVLCSWTTSWAEKFGHNVPKSWKFSYQLKDNFESLGKDLEEFYLNLPAKIKPEDIPFEPHCYITARTIPTELTMKWIEKNGFPTAPVYSVDFEKSKVDVAKESGIDIFVDDRFENFVELNKAGICTFLLTAPHNERYDVGYKRVDSLKELFERFK